MESEPGEQTPSPAIPSGTVAILRDGTDGLEVLMVRRPASERDTFSGLWVFPGGKVEKSDFVDDESELGLALRAAVRETQEEVALQLESHELVPLNRWEPKPVQALTKRFSAWVFLARATDADVVVDGVEIHDHDWLAPVDAIERHRGGEIGLSPPTWHTLHELAQHQSVDLALRWASQREPEHYYSSFGEVDGHTIIVWHGDALSGGADHQRHRLWLIDGAWRYERTR